MAVLQVEGQLIVGNRQELKDLVQAALDAGERRILIDFSRTGYIDSSGLGALVSISKRIREAGGELRLSGLNEDLRSLFELTKLDTLFAIAETPQQALAQLLARPTDAVAAPPLRPPLAGPGRRAAPRTLVTLRLPSDVACIEEAVELVTRHCLAGHDAPHERPGSGSRSCSREALSNAIMRGNREDRGKWVDVRAELGAEVIRLDVTDEGPGSIPTAVPEPIRPEQLDEANGRGLYLIRKLVDAVNFNEQGNSICMILRRP